MKAAAIATAAALATPYAAIRSNQLGISGRTTLLEHGASRRCGRPGPRNANSEGEYMLVGKSKHRTNQLERASPRFCSALCAGP